MSCLDFSGFELIVGWVCFGVCYLECSFRGVSFYGYCIIFIYLFFFKILLLWIDYRCVIWGFGVLLGWCVLWVFGWWFRGAWFSCFPDTDLGVFVVSQLELRG